MNAIIGSLKREKIMNYDIEKNKGNIPLYKIIKSRIIEAINNGEFNADKQLPTERALCNAFKVSRGTIKKVFYELETEGIIRKVQGKGTFPVGKNMIEQREFLIDSIRNFINNLEAVNLNESQIKDIFMKEFWRNLKEDEKVSIAWVDCSEELLRMSQLQIMNRCNVNIQTFLIEDVKRNPHILKQDFDFFATTLNHYNDLKKCLNSYSGTIEQVILTVSNKTISDIAMIEDKNSIVVLYKSENYLKLVDENLKMIIGDYSKNYINIKDITSAAIEEICSYNTIIVPPDFKIGSDKFGSLFQNKNIITFEYILDEGSLIHLYERAKRYWIDKHSKY